MAPDAVELRTVGRRVPQLEGADKVTGRAVYTPDVVLEGMAHGAILRSPHAHAEIRAIDTAAARAFPGVLAIITGRDLPGIPYVHISKFSDRFPLAREKVRFFGEEVAAVAAETRAIAEEACRLIKVDYRPLPAVHEPEDALAPGAPEVNRAPADTGERNVALKFSRDFGDVAKGFAEAALVVEGDYRNGVVSPVAMETNGTVARWEGGRLTLWTATQAPFYIRKEVAHVLRLEPACVHIKPVAVGGGFGGKAKICEQEALAAALAIAAERPVRLVLTRYEDLVAGKTDHGKAMRVRTAVDAEGNILARSSSLLIDNGAYTAFGPVYVAAARQRTCNLYRVAAAHYDCRLAFTNKVPGGAYRGMGAPQIIWAIEDQVDEIAERLGIDPIDYRIKIANRPGDVTPLGWEITSCALAECLEVVRERLGWTEKRANPVPWRGVGVASMIHPSAGVLYEEGNYANVGVELTAEGRVRLATMTADAGTWQNTMLAQLCGEAMGLDPTLFEVIHMDTEASPVDLGSAASRVTYVTGNAAADAGRRLVAAIGAALGARYGLGSVAAVIMDCKVHLTGLNRPPLDLAEVFQAVGPLRVIGSFSTPATRPDPETGYGNYAAAYCFGAQGAEVEIDPVTGKVRVLKLVAAQDVGRAINPTAIEGQIQGGVVQGIGMALSEEMVFEEGRPVTTSYLDYKVPRFDDLPDIEVVTVDSIDAIGPFGAKAAGEPSINATVAAIANAVANAIGVRMRELPMTPERILAAIKARDGTPDIATRPFTRRKNFRVAAVRSLYPSLVFPALRTFGPRLAGPETAPVARAPHSYPRSVAEALAHLAEDPAGSKIRAGGTDLSVGIKQGIYSPAAIVDISRIASLAGIAATADTLTLGAGARLADVARHPDVPRLAPMVVEAIGQLATPQIRNMATVGGDLCQQKRCWFFRSALPCYKLKGATCPCFAVLGDSRNHAILSTERCNAPCPADLAPVFAALGATAVIASPAGERRVPMDGFYRWSGEPDIAPGEILTAIEIPVRRPTTATAFEKFALSKGYFGVASVAVSLDLAEGVMRRVRVAMGSVSPFPERARGAEELLEGARPTPALIAEAARATVTGALPLKPAAYKTGVLVGLTERALARATG